MAAQGRHGATLEAIEEEVISAAGDAATLVGVITTSKMREFVLYSRASEQIPDFHDELRRAFPKYDVQVVTEEDPDWQVYDDFNHRGDRLRRGSIFVRSVLVQRADHCVPPTGTSGAPSGAVPATLDSR